MQWNNVQFLPRTATHVKYYPLTVVLYGEVGGDKRRGNSSGGGVEGSASPLVLVHLHYCYLCMRVRGEGVRGGVWCGCVIPSNMCF